MRENIKKSEKERKMFPNSYHGIMTDTIEDKKEQEKYLSEKTVGIKGKLVKGITRRKLKEMLFGDDSHQVAVAVCIYWKFNDKSIVPTMLSILRKTKKIGDALNLAEGALFLGQEKVGPVLRKMYLDESIDIKARVGIELILWKWEFIKRKKHDPYTDGKAERERLEKGETLPFSCIKEDKKN